MENDAGDTADTMGRRAIATATERDRIKHPDDVDDARIYQAISRVRRKIRDELATDADLFAEHHPELYADLVEQIVHPEMVAILDEQNPELVAELRDELCDS